METTTKTPAKTKLTINVSNEAVDVLRFAGYCSDHTIGKFISLLILEHHERMQQAKSKLPPTAIELAADLLRKVAERLDPGAQERPG